MSLIILGDHNVDKSFRTNAHPDPFNGHRDIPWTLTSRDWWFVLGDPGGVANQPNEHVFNEGFLPWLVLILAKMSAPEPALPVAQAGSSVKRCQKIQGKQDMMGLCHLSYWSVQKARLGLSVHVHMARVYEDWGVVLLVFWWPNFMKWFSNSCKEDTRMMNQIRGAQQLLNNDGQWEIQGPMDQQSVISFTNCYSE